MAETDNVAEAPAPEAQDPSRFKIPPALAAMAAAALKEEKTVAVESVSAAKVVEVPAIEPPPPLTLTHVGVVPEAPPAEPKEYPTKVEIRNVPVDLTNLEVSTSSSLVRNAAANRILSRKATFMVLCPQSAYMAKMSSLCLEDKVRILNSVDSPFENRRKTYKMVYDHVDEMNIPKPKFDDWLRVTSYHDIETLLFGIYAQTYPGESDFDVTCAKCDQKVEARIGPHLMQQVKDEKEFAHVAGAATSSDSKDVQAASMVHTTSRILLAESGIVADIVTPSLSDHLVLLKAFNPKAIADVTNIVGMMLFIKQLFIPDAETMRRDGKPVFFRTEERAEVMQIVSKLSTTDGDKLNDDINERAKRFETNYQLPKMACASCGAEIPPISIDIENVLFSKMVGSRP